MKNCTPTTPTLSDADVSMVTMFVSVAPAAGAVMVIVGGVVSAVAVVVAETGALGMEVLPAASTAATV